MVKILRTTSFLLLVTPFLALPALGLDKPNFKVQGAIESGGDGGWDYLTVDSSTKRLFVARASRVEVYDLETNTRIGELTPVDGAHGIAIAPEQGLILATAGKAGKVIAFNAKTYEKVWEVPAGENPDALLYEPFSKQVFVFSGKSQDFRAIDLQKKTVSKTAKLDGVPEFAAVDEKGKVYVNIEDKNEWVAIDAATATIVSTWPIKGCEGPTGLSINPKTNHLMVGCGNKKALTVDAATGKILKTFSVGEGVDATVYDSVRNLFFVSAGEGQLTVIEDDNKGGKSIQQVPTQKGARTLAVDTASGKIYLPTSQFEPKVAGTPGHAKPIAGTFKILIVEKK